jgi:cation:H+ antiporter
MLFDALWFVGGLALLLAGGKLLVNASVDTATRLRISPLVVGLTLVAWGTSAPELALNIASALKGRGELALGNVVGANICNMALVLGVSAIIRPLIVDLRLIRVEVWLNAAILTLLAAAAWFFARSGEVFPRWLALVLLAVFASSSAGTILGAIRVSRAASAAIAQPASTGDAAPASRTMGWGAIALCFGSGLLMLSLGGAFASDGASGFAARLGVPAAIVGVTIVSIGTTLPELVTSVLAVRKGQADLAMGNAVGSCIFNAGAILGLVGLLAPAPVPASLQVPLIFMGALALALIVIARTFDRTVARIEGVLLLGSYVAFLALAALAASRASVAP